jgi:murein DD-endopeptidase MepM/ murein hydrolase activator NlpD
MPGMIMDDSQKMRGKNGLFPDDPDYFSILANKETERLYSAFNENSRDYNKRKLWVRCRKVFKVSVLISIVGGMLVLTVAMFKQAGLVRQENRALSTVIAGLNKSFGDRITQNEEIIGQLTEKAAKYRELEKNILVLQKEIPGIGGIMMDAYNNIDQMSLDQIQMLPKSEKEAYFREKIELNGLKLYSLIYEDWEFPVSEPAYSYVSSEYGLRTDPFHPKSKKNNMHIGLDIVSPYDPSIRSVYDGIVYENGYSNVYGYYTLIRHNMKGVDIRTLYAHAEVIKVKKGQVVEKGQEIALIGDTGNTRGRHLHFEVRGPFLAGQNRAKRINPVKNSTYGRVVY